MIPSILLAQALAFLFLWIEATLAICYFPDGNVTQQDTPCLPDQVAAGRASFCCGSGYACTSDKLCKATSLSGNINFTRGSCTDKTWNSPDCPSFCLDYLSGGVGVNQCPKPYDTEFCCTDNSQPCNCSGDSGVLNFFSEYSILTTIDYIPSTSAQSTTSSSGSSTIISQSSTTSTQSTTSSSQSTSTASLSGKTAGQSNTAPASTLSTNSQSSTPMTSSSSTSASTGASAAASQTQAAGQQNSGPNTTAIAIAVPVSCVAVLLALGIVLLYRHHQKKSSTAYRESQPPYPVMAANNQLYKDDPQNKNHSFAPYPIQEMGRHSPPIPELSNNPISPQELRGY